MTFPKTTCPTSVDSIPARLTASRTHFAASSLGGISFKAAAIAADCCSHTTEHHNLACHRGTSCKRILVRPIKNPARPQIEQPNGANRLSTAAQQEPPSHPNYTVFQSLCQPQYSMRSNISTSLPLEMPLGCLRQTQCADDLRAELRLPVFRIVWRVRTNCSAAGESGLALHKTTP